MQDFPENLIALIDEQLRRVSKTATVVLRMPAGHDEVDALMAMNRVESLILAAPDQALIDRYPRRLGWYDPVQFKVVLPDRVGGELFYVGAQWDFGFRAAFKAWRNGATTLHLFSVADGYRRSTVSTLAIEQLLAALIYLLGRTKAAPVVEWFIQVNARRLSEKWRKQRPRTYVPNPGHVLFVAGSLGPGGAERQIVNTILGLKARGVTDISLLHENAMVPPHDFFYPQLEQAGISCAQLSSINALSSQGLNSSREVGKLRKMLRAAAIPDSRVTAYVLEFRERRPEIIHTWLDDVNVIAGLAAVLAGVPKIVIGCRSLAPHHFPFHQPYMKPLYRMLCECPNVTVLNNSRAGAESYEAWLGELKKKVRVLHNGFDFPRIAPAGVVREASRNIRIELGISPEARIVGTVMRLSDEKNPELWVKSAELVSQHEKNAYFVVVGDGPLRERLESMAASLGIQSKVLFLGKRQDIPDLLAMMDVFVLTSKVEGLPNVLIEAQALGVPVVATHVGGVAEVFENGVTGVLVDDHSPVAVAEAVLRLFSDEAMVERSRERAPVMIRDRFSIARMVNETLKVYGINDRI
jgi:glycosyltransferase involved in cell wall biosynthesis